MVDDPDATTNDHMTDPNHVVGTATVPAATPRMEPYKAPAPATIRDHLPFSPARMEPYEAPAPPPAVAAKIDEVLRWIATVATTAGLPDAVEVSATIRHVSVAAPNQTFFARWMTAIGAVAQTTRHDALGATVVATTVNPQRWTVTVHAHVNTVTE